MTRSTIGDLQAGDDVTAWLGDIPVPIDQVIIRAVGTIYGDWNDDCVITNRELADLRSAIAGGPPSHNPLMDYNCDGVLTNAVEVPAFLANMTKQPPCGRDGGPDGGEGDGGDAPPYEYYDDVPALAAWLVETLSPEALAAFKDDPAAAVVEFAGTPAGDDLTSLLIYLQ